MYRPGGVPHGRSTPQPEPLQEGLNLGTIQDLLQTAWTNVEEKKTLGIRDHLQPPMLFDPPHGPGRRAILYQHYRAITASLPRSSGNDLLLPNITMPQMSRGRRSKMRGKARKTSYALDEEALEIFAEVAERLGISVSALLRMVARKLRSGEFKL